MSAAGERNVTVGLFARRTLRGQCLARFLELSGLGPRMVTFESAINGSGLVEPDTEIDVAVVDTGEQTCGDEGIKAILSGLAETLPHVPIVVVSDREDSAAVFEALLLGARAYVPSSLDPEILLETLRFVHKGGTFVPLDVLINLIGHQRVSHSAEVKPTDTHGLTEGEFRVLELLRRGEPNKVIARALEIEEGTVKVHVRRIMKKLNAANRTQAALAAQQLVEASQ
jgi:two-component system nitrate/nitrite response regulator NarL